jgi:hypothetical protein
MAWSRHPHEVIEQAGDELARKPLRPTMDFFLASGRDPRRELVSLGKHGETIFFLKQQNGGGLSASFGGQPLFFCIFWGHTGGPRWGCQHQGISRPGGRVHLWLWIRLSG